MLIFWDQRLVILATPKTGSTAIEIALESLASVTVERPPALKHTPAYRYERFLKPYLERSADASFTVVALMREPIAWLGSWYRFRQRDDIVDTPQSTREIDFEAFVNGYMADPRPPFADIGAQARFLGGKQGPGVDRLFRYEKIDTFVTFLEEWLDCVIELPVVNVSPSGSLDLPDNVRKRIENYCAEDMRLYQAIGPDGMIRKKDIREI
jgi:hypothetical protein